MEILEKEDIIQILKIVSDSKISEFYLKTGDLKLKATRSIEEKKVYIHEETVPAIPADSEPAAAPNEGKAVKAADVESDETGLIPVKASLLGTFYRSPKPGAPAFVEVGQTVAEDDVICIIEVMKLFNSTTAGVNGRIKKICAKDGDLVEFGQTLFLIEPAGE
jgi:acetyl-CoA carboxylase biotin carboxyl carrier protein